MFSDQQALFLKETLQVIPHSMRINMPDKLTVELGSREPLNQYKRAIYHHYSLSFWNRVWDKMRERWVTWPALRLFECIFLLVVIGETLSFSAQAAASPPLLLLSDTQQVAERKIIIPALHSNKEINEYAFVIVFEKSEAQYAALRVMMVKWRVVALASWL